MKRLILTAVLTICMVGVAQADLYIDHVDVNKRIDNDWFGDPSKSSWDHMNPYTGGNYDDALAAGLIDWVKLTINASDIESGDVVKIEFEDKYNNWHHLGNLSTGSSAHDTTFDLDKTWLDDVAVKGRITSSSWCSTDDAYLHWSELKVEGSPVPVPAAVLLGILGLGVAGIKLRKFA